MPIFTTVIAKVVLPLPILLSLKNRRFLRLKRFLCGGFLVSTICCLTDSSGGPTWFGFLLVFLEPAPAPLP